MKSAKTRAEPAIYQIIRHLSAAAIIARNNRMRVALRNAIFVCGEAVWAERDRLAAKKGKAPR